MPEVKPCPSPSTSSDCSNRSSALSTPRTPSSHPPSAAAGCANPPAAAACRASPCSSLGLVLLVVGVAVRALWLADSFPVLSVVGFLVMLGGAVLAVTAVGAKGQPQAGTAKRGEPDKNRFTGRMEERFRRRFEQE